MQQIAVAGRPRGAFATPLPVNGCTCRGLSIETTRLVLRAVDAADPGMVELTILLKPGFVEAGRIRFVLRGGIDREAEFDCFLEPSWRRRGLMREAALAAAPRVLHLLRARSIHMMLPADARAAQGIARALGLVASPARGTLLRFEKDLCGLI